MDNCWSNFYIQYNIIVFDLVGDRYDYIEVKRDKPENFIRRNERSRHNAGHDVSVYRRY